jgi:hypothetical protein
VIIELLVLLAGAWLLLGTSTPRAVSAYVVLVTIVSVIAGPAVHAPLSLAFFIMSFFLKLVVAPLGIWEFARRNAAARNLRPAVGLPLRLVLVLALAGGAQSVAYMPALVAMPMASTVAYVLLCGLALLVIHRNLLGQVIGLLVLGTGVTLAGAVCAPQLRSLRG